MGRPGPIELRHWMDGRMDGWLDAWIDIWKWAVIGYLLAQNLQLHPPTLQHRTMKCTGSAFFPTHSFWYMISYLSHALTSCDRWMNDTIHHCVPVYPGSLSVWTSCVCVSVCMVQVLLMLWGHVGPCLHSHIMGTRLHHEDKKQVTITRIIDL